MLRIVTDDFRMTYGDLQRLTERYGDLRKDAVHFRVRIFRFSSDTVAAAAAAQQSKNHVMGMLPAFI